MVLNTNKHTYNKKKRNLSIDKDLIKTVKKYKINIYLFLSDKLNEYITNNNLWTGRDLNPWPPPCEGGDLPLIYQPYL
jgi:hypothetical protein